MALEKAKQATAKAEDEAKGVADSKPFRAVVTAGLITVGAVHILIGILALQMAWAGGNDKNADQKGALAALASNPLGGVLMWIAAIAMIGVFVWKLTQAWWGYTWESGAKRTAKRIGAAGGGVVYLVLAITAIRYALGSSDQSSDSKQQSWSGKLLSSSFGQVLATAVAIGIVIYAGVLIKRGITASFTEDFEGEPSSAVKRLGQVGFCAKGVAIGLVGVLFGWAALSYDPKKAGGLDDALHTVNRQGAIGPVLLTLIALGLMAYGVYCFSWSRHARR